VLADRRSVDTAQRGWLTPDDVINTWPLSRLCASPAQKTAESPQ
jgi:DNA polymerase (family 10)